MIYLVKCAGLYKIGYSKNVQQRVRDLQIGNPEPLELVMSRPGSLITEQRAHYKFRHKCVQGEWFDLNDDDLAALSLFLEPFPKRPKRRGRMPPNYWPRPCSWCGRKPRMDGEGKIFCECGWVWTNPWTESLPKIG